MAAAGGAEASSSAGERGRDEWLRVYDRMVAMLRKSQKQVEALAGDRGRLEALIKIQHEFWVSRDGILQGCLDELRRTDACRRKCEASKLELLLGDKEREVRRVLEYAKLQDDDLMDFKICADALAAENAQLKIKIKEVESRAELSGNTADLEGCARNSREEIRTLKKAYTTLAAENAQLKIKIKEVESRAELSGNTANLEGCARNSREEIRTLKKAYTTLSSKNEKEITALLAEKDFVWNQLKTMEKDYNSVLKKKKMEAAQATEAAQKLQQSVEELQVVGQEKENEVRRLQAEADHAKKKILDLEDKLQEMYTLANEKDEEIKKLKGGHRQASQKWKQDISGTHRKSRSEGPASRGISKNNPRKKMVEEDQAQNSQKRKCASSLATGLQRCSSRLHAKSPVSPASQQVLFHSNFKVPKLKTPTTPPSL